MTVGLRFITINGRDHVSVDRIDVSSEDRPIMIVWRR